MFFWIAAIDAVLVMGTGLIAAGMFLAGKDTASLTDRVVPAVAVLIGTSAAAGVIMAVGRWLVGG